MDFIIKRGVLKEYCGNAEEVVIPTGVRKIGKGVFNGHRCRKITRLVIPEGVTEIGDYAFQELEKLTDLALPATLQHIGSQAFAGCRSLTVLTIPEGVGSIGYGAFEYCENLETVQLPSGLTRIPDRLFRMCGRLSRVNIPEGVTEIGDWAFAWCGELTRLQLPPGVARLGDSAFYECKKLKRINVPAHCYIAHDAFTCCYDLAQPDGLVILQNRVLIQYPGDRKEVWLVIPDGVESIADDALTGSTVRHVEMNLHCPLWSTVRDAPDHLAGRALLTADGSTVSFRDDTGKIVAKVILAVRGELGKDRMNGLFSIRQKDHSFDFAWYDGSWELLKQVENRLRVALVRLQYPYALPAWMEKRYKETVSGNSRLAGKLAVDSGQPELLGMLLARKLLLPTVFPELVDYANQAGQLEMTALLLQAQYISGETTARK